MSISIDNSYQLIHINVCFYQQLIIAETLELRLIMVLDHLSGL